MTVTAAATGAAPWTARVFFAGLTLLVLGTLLVVLGLLKPAALLPGIVVLMLAMLVLAAAGVLWVVTDD